MSKLLNNYINLKKQNPEFIYLFKAGAFYLALEDDAKFLSNNFNLKLVELNKDAVKCGFPCTSFDKYYLKLKDINKDFKIVEKDNVSDTKTYLENNEINELLIKIKNVDIDNLSVGQAYSFIEDLNKISIKILGGLNEFDK